MWDYRVVAFYLFDQIPPSPPPAVGEASKPIAGLSPEFLKAEFPDQFNRRIDTNTALQVQRLLRVYGSRGWEHYTQCQVASQYFLFFRRLSGSESTTVYPPLTPMEQSLLQKLDVEQHP